MAATVAPYNAKFSDSLENIWGTLVVAKSKLLFFLKILIDQPPPPFDHLLLSQEYGT